MALSLCPDATSSAATVSAEVTIAVEKMATPADKTATAKSMWQRHLTTATEKSKCMTTARSPEPTSSMGLVPGNWICHIYFNSARINSRSLYFLIFLHRTSPRTYDMIFSVSLLA